MHIPLDRDADETLLMEEECVDVMWYPMIESFRRA